MYYNRFPFSIIINDGKSFPNMPAGELLIYGKHDQAIGRCDYEGNMENVHPDANIEKNEVERFILINNDRASIMAWHGERKKQLDGKFDNGRRLGKINWKEALAEKQSRNESKQLWKKNHQ